MLHFHSLGERTSHRGFLGATLGTETLTDLDYADDVALLSEMLEVLLLALDVLQEEASPLGLEVNWQRTTPPQLLPLIQTRRLRFLGHVARMSDS